MDTRNGWTLSEQVRKVEHDRDKAQEVACYASKAFHEMYDAVETLIHNVKQRHPGEALRCPDMIRLEGLLEKYNSNDGG